MIAIDYNDVSTYIKNRLNTLDKNVDLDTIDLILDLELCFLEERGLTENTSSS